MVIKGKAPVSNEVLKVKLPKPQEADLPNGLHLIVLEDHRLPQVTFQIIIPGAGGYYDPADEDRPGELHRVADARGHEDAHLAADLRGARDDGGHARPSAAACRARSRRVSGSALTEDFAAADRPGGRRPAEPVVPADGVGPLQGADARRADPAAHATRLPGERDVQPGGLRRPSGGPRVADARRRSTRSRREALVEFHRTHYVPDHAAIAFAGDISLADARKLVEAKLGGWKKAGAPKPTVDRAAAAPARRRCTSIARPNSVQTTPLCRHAVDDAHRSRLRAR